MDSKKRKQGPNGNGEARAKKSKGGSGGKWQTPNQKAKVAAFRGRGSIEPGDVGIWGTCARGQEGRATAELRSLLYEYAEQFYGITPEEDEDEDEVEEIVDIEASIRKEAASMDSKSAKPKLFSPVRLDLECVLFFKVRPPVDPVDFVHRICQEIVSNPATKRTRYLNRLTPMTLMGKATEKGLEEVANTVLSDHFKLEKQEEVEGGKERVEGDEAEPKEAYYLYAIRPTIRNHNRLKRDVVIKQIASLIADVHQVNLTRPDRVILVEIYQTVCGMSVVGSDWEALKRYNLAELYQYAPKVGATVKTGAMPERVTTDEALAVTAIVTDSLDPNKLEI